MSIAAVFFGDEGLEDESEGSLSPLDLMQSMLISPAYSRASEPIVDSLYSAIALTTIGDCFLLSAAGFHCNDIGHKMNNEIEVFLRTTQAAKTEFHEEPNVSHGVRHRHSPQVD